MRIYIECVIGRVNAPPLVVLLAEGQCTAIHSNTVHICIASNCGLW